MGEWFFLSNTLENYRDNALKINEVMVKTILFKKFVKKFSLIIIFIIILFGGYNIAKAARNWVSTNTLSEWRILRIYTLDPNDTGGCLKLGASKWNIQNSVDGANFIEDWVSSSWYQPDTNTGKTTGAHKVTLSFVNKTQAELDDPASPDHCSDYLSVKLSGVGKNGKVFYPAGEYGFIWVNGDSAIEGNYFGEWGGGVSYPIEWQITGVAQ